MSQTRQQVFVFSTETLNAAASDIQKGLASSLIQWHQSKYPLMNPNMVNMMDQGQRNSPSYPPGQQPPQRNLKRKNTGSWDQNPTPSPQMPAPSPQIQEFKQPMSNQPPNYGVGDYSNVKSEPKDLNVDENNPLKKMEIMASFSNDKPIKTENTNKSREEKMAKLDEISRCLNQAPMSSPMYPPNMRMPPQQPIPNFPHGYPPNGQMPPQFMNGNFPMHGQYNPQQFPNGMPDPNGMPPGPYMPQGMHPGMPPQNGFPQQMQSPRFVHQMPQGMMPMQGGQRPFPPGMDMGMQRNPNAPDAFNWQGNMSQPISNLDSRVPNQKMQYFANGQGSMANPMPPPAPTT